MPTTGVTVVSVPVSDQDRSLAFYTEVLGMTLLADMVMDESMRWVQVAPPGSATSLTLVTWFDTMPAGTLRGLVLEIDDLDATVGHLALHSVATSDVQEMPWGRFVTTTDPDGNGIVLQVTAPPSPDPSVPDPSRRSFLQEGPQSHHGDGINQCVPGQRFVPQSDEMSYAHAPAHSSRVVRSFANSSDALEGVAPGTVLVATSALTRVSTPAPFSLPQGIVPFGRYLKGARVGGEFPGGTHDGYVRDRTSERARPDGAFRRPRPSALAS